MVHDAVRPIIPVLYIYTLYVEVDTQSFTRKKAPHTYRGPLAAVMGGGRGQWRRLAAEGLTLSWL